MKFKNNDSRYKIKPGFENGETISSILEKIDQRGP
jgi:hypothetical protein